MMKNKNTVWVLLALLSMTCTPKTDFDLTDFDKKLVIWAYLKTDEVVEINVSRTTSPLDNIQDRKVPDARVLLYENDVLVDTLKHIESGTYRSEAEIIPIDGRTYQIQVLHNDYPTLTTPKDTIPNRPDILSHDFNIEIDSIYSTKKYYVDLNIQVSSEQAYIADKIEDKPFNVFNYWSNHTLACSQDGLFGYIFDFNGYRGVDYSCFNHPFSISFSERYSGSLPQAITVSLCHIPENAPDFHNKLADVDLYTNEQDTDIFIDPVYLPQVVENGYGYFGTYSCAEMYIEF